MNSPNLINSVEVNVIDAIFLKAEDNDTRNARMNFS